MMLHRHARMNRLALLFHSTVRAEVLRLLFGLRSNRMYRAEIIGCLNFAQRSVEEELEKLVALDLLETTKDGNRRYYSAKREHPWYPELRNLVLKSTGLGDVLGAVLKSEKIEFGFVFGSLAALTDKADSDVDLMVIGRMGLRELAPRLRGAVEQIGREINPHAYSRDELLRRVKVKDHFLNDVLAKPKLFIVGNPREFGDLVGQPVAAPA